MGQCSSSEATELSTEVVFEYTGKGCLVPKDVTTVRFHPSVVEVEKCAFEDCINLRVVMFNEGLQKIGRFAFYCCTSLSSIILPSTITEIERGAFHNCKHLSEVTLNEELQKIGETTFASCTSLESITIPSTVTKIGSSAFRNCDNLGEVVLNEGMQKIGDWAFFNCNSLSSITLPSTVTEIGEYAFYLCRNLREVVFRGSSIILPSTVTEIGSHAFDHCSSLREVLLHDGLQKIGVYAFINCTSLDRFTFPTISARLDTLIQTGHWEEIENEVNKVRGVVEVSGSELFVSAQTMGGGRNWNLGRVRESLDKIVRLVAFYESQLPILDIVFTDACDIGVPGPVKDKVLQYLI